MDQPRKLDLRLVWGAVAAVLAAAALWAGTALAADDSTSTDSNSPGTPPAQSVQGEGTAPDRGDCPEPGGGDPGSGGGSQSDSSGYPAAPVSAGV
jgi:hypothetical protein